MFSFGNVLAREIRYYLLRHHSLFLTKGEGNVQKNGTCGEINLNGQIDPRERMEATLRKLQILKSRITELRAHCEELQRTRNEEQNSGCIATNAAEQ